MSHLMGSCQCFTIRALACGVWPHVQQRRERLLRDRRSSSIRGLHAVTGWIAAVLVLQLRR